MQEQFKENVYSFVTYYFFHYLNKNNNRTKSLKERNYENSIDFIISKNLLKAALRLSLFSIKNK